MIYKYLGPIHQSGVNLNLEPGDYKLKYLSGGSYATGRYRTHTSFAKKSKFGCGLCIFYLGEYYSVSSIERYH